MHKSAYISGSKFFERYVSGTSISILEIGSFNVNGTLRDFKPVNSTWMGIDLEPGPGVDLVISDMAALPFPDGSFDFVVASSVFEHDSTFWLTFNEMVRVLRKGGYIYLNSPSNGMIHRYPLDVYRFYPDAGKALEKWGKIRSPELRLIESFIGSHNDEPWNDFCAVFGLEVNKDIDFIYVDSKCENVWKGDYFIAETFAEWPEDQRNYSALENKYSALENQYSALENQYSALENQYSALDNQYSALENQLILAWNKFNGLVNSKSWKITIPLRWIITMLTNFK